MITEIMDTWCVGNGRGRQTDRQTATLNCEISIRWETKPRTTPQNNYGLLKWPEQVTGPKTLQSMRWFWWRNILITLGGIL